MQMRVNKVHCSNLRNCQQGDRQAPDLKVNKLPQVENHGFKLLYNEEVECALGCFINDTLQQKKMQYQYAPLTGVYKPDMKEFFS